MTARGIPPIKQTDNSKMLSAKQGNTSNWQGLMNRFSAGVEIVDGQDGIHLYIPHHLRQEIDAVIDLWALEDEGSDSHNEAHLQILIDTAYRTGLSLDSLELVTRGLDIHFVTKFCGNLSDLAKNKKSSDI